LSAQISKSINQFNKNLCCLFIFEVFGSGSFLGALLFLANPKQTNVSRKNFWLGKCLAVSRENNDEEGKG